MSGVNNENGEDLVQELENKMILLKCDDDETRSLNANLTILAQHSQYFEGTLAFPVDGQITFDSNIVSFAALKKITTFLDTGVLSPSMEDIKELLSAADYLQVDTALSLLIEYLYADLEEQMKKFKEIFKGRLVVYLRTYAAVRRFEMKHNYEHRTMTIQIYTGGWIKSDIPVSFDFVLALHFNRIWNEKEILYLDVDHLKTLLSADSLIITEQEALRTIKLWVYFDLEGRRKYFVQLLRCLRPDLMAKTILEELTCHCPSEQTCSCLSSPEFAVALLAFDKDPTAKGKTGPLNWTKRSRNYNN